MTYGGLSNEVRRLPPHQRPRLITDVQHSVTTFAPDAPSDAWNDDRAAHPEGRAARFLATSHPRHSSGKAYVPMTTEEVREEVTDHLFRNMRERTRALTFQDIVAEIPRLSHDERLALLEALRQSLREESARADSGSLLRLRGVLKPDAPLPDTYDYKEAYANSLIEKYR